MQIKAVLFDLDDTLWPLLPLIEHAELTLYNWMQDQVPGVTQSYSLQELRSQRVGMVPEDARFRYDLWALRHAALSRVFLEQGEDVAKVECAMQIFAAARNQVSLYQDVVPGLTALGEHVVLGSISNGFADLEKIGLAAHFRVSLAAHQFGCAKPDPAIFLAACATLGVAPENALYVGDDLICDVHGSQQAGLRSVWMNRAHRLLPRESDTTLLDGHHPGSVQNIRQEGMNQGMKQGGQKSPQEFKPDFECSDVHAIVRFVQENHQRYKIMSEFSSS